MSTTSQIHKLTRFPIGFWSYTNFDQIGTEAVKDYVDCGMTLVQTPRFRPEEIPVRIGTETELGIPIMDYPLAIDERRLRLTFVSMGNPHAVCFVDGTVASFPLAELGPKVVHHPIFPEGANFEIAEVISRGRIAARVWERGVGETPACGSGACAIVVAAWLHGYVEQQIDIILPGGNLWVDWDGKGDVMLAGSAEVVFEGEWIEKEVKHANFKAY